MKDQRRTEIKVGITVIMGLLIFLWILGWAKNFSLTSNHKPVLIRFDNVTGLEIGDNVMVNGLRKGFVKDMKIQQDHVLVTLSLEKDVNLREDAQFSISMLDLMGGKKVGVSPGVSSADFNYNSVHNGVFYADIPSVMSMLGSVQGDIVASLKDMRITLSSANKYLTDDELTNNIKSSAANLNQISQKMILMIDENRESFKKLASNGAAITSEAKDFIANNKEGIRTSLEELKVLLKKTDTLMTSANEFTSEVKNKNNNLGKLLYDKELYDNLTQSVAKLSELSKILLEQIKKEGINIDAHIKLF
ncbi:MAG: MlaD family protein [Ignavibacteriaceae bacterium]|nr:MlaD family protein [Ignavibacteriaceae bacterium]